MDNKEKIKQLKAEGLKQTRKNIISIKFDIAKLELKNKKAEELKLKKAVSGFRSWLWYLLYRFVLWLAVCYRKRSIKQFEKQLKELEDLEKQFANDENKMGNG